METAILHLVFDRPNQRLHVYEPDGKSWDVAASGDAWGDGVSGPHGHDYPIAPGHYQLPGQIDHFNPPLASEGAAQIYVSDLGMAIGVLERAGRAKKVTEGQGEAEFYPLYDIGGIEARVGGLAKFERSEVMIHAGGSNAPDPQAPVQPLLKTYGCTRVENRDLPALVDVVGKYRFDHTIVFSVVGDPKPVAD